MTATTTSTPSPHARGGADGLGGGRTGRSMRIGSTQLLAIAMALDLLVLVADIELPPGYAVDMLYVVAMGLGFWMARPGEIVALGVFPTLCIAVHTAVLAGSAALDDPRVMANRVMALTALWMVALLALSHRRSAVALRRSEAALRQAQSFSQLGYFELAADPAAEGELSREARQMLGDANGAKTSRDELVGRMHPDDREAARRAIAEAVERAEGFEIEFRALHPGRRHPPPARPGRAGDQPAGPGGAPCRLHGRRDRATRIPSSLCRAARRGCARSWRPRRRPSSRSTSAASSARSARRPRRCSAMPRRR